MEKKLEGSIEDNRGNIILENRKKMTLTGVEEVISFDDEKILLNTKLGALTIKGQNLKMNKLDVQNGDVMINGEIYYIVYSGKEVKKEKMKFTPASIALICIGFTSSSTFMIWLNCNQELGKLYGLADPSKIQSFNSMV